MVNDEEVLLFVSNLTYDVCEYFLQNVYNKFQGYYSPRTTYFSLYGRKVLFKFLRENSEAFLTELQNNINLQSLTEASLLEACQNIIEASKWRQVDHSQFFVLCGKLVILKVSTEEKSEFSDKLIYEQMIKLAAEAKELGILYQHYDKIRKFAVEVVYAVFKWGDMKLKDYMDTDFHCCDIQIPSHILTYLDISGHLLLHNLETSENFNRMTLQNFKIVIHCFTRTHRDAIKNEDNYAKVCELALYIGLLAAHCARVGYKEGINLAFDAIIYELVSYFKRPNSQRVKIL